MNNGGGERRRDSVAPGCGPLHAVRLQRRPLSAPGAGHRHAVSDVRAVRAPGGRRTARADTAAAGAREVIDEGVANLDRLMKGEGQ